MIIEKNCVVYCVFVKRKKQEALWQKSRAPSFTGRVETIPVRRGRKALTNRLRYCIVYCVSNIPNDERKDGFQMTDDAAKEIKTERHGERLVELDLLKVVAIVAMIVCHAVIMLGAHHENYEGDLAYFIGDYVLGCYLAVAHAFMFAMGVGIVSTEKNRPADLVKRGVFLYLAGYVLNFFRYGVYALADGLIEGEFLEETAYAFLVQDIFHFAGLALVFTGVLKALRCREWQICLVGVALSFAGAPLAFLYSGNAALEYLLGHFVVTTEDGSTFAFLNWYVFVGAGLLFGRILRQTKDRDRLYRLLFFVSAPCTVVYVVLTFVFGAMFLCKNGWYYAVSFPEAVGLLSIDLTLLSSFYFLQKRLPERVLLLSTETSRNLTPIYFSQWCVIGFVDSIFCYLLGFVIPYPAAYAFGVALIVVSYWIAKGWRAMQRKIRRRNAPPEPTA